MAGLVQYNGNNTRKSNHNVANNTEEKSFEIYQFWQEAVQMSWHGVVVLSLTSRVCPATDSSNRCVTEKNYYSLGMFLFPKQLSPPSLSRFSRSLAAKLSFIGNRSSLVLYYPNV